MFKKYYIIAAILFTTLAPLNILHARQHQDECTIFYDEYVGKILKSDEIFLMCKLYEDADTLISRINDVTTKTFLISNLRGIRDMSIDAASIYVLTNGSIKKTIESIGVNENRQSKLFISGALSGAETAIHLVIDKIITKNINNNKNLISRLRISMTYANDKDIMKALDGIILFTAEVEKLVHKIKAGTLISY